MIRPRLWYRVEIDIVVELGPAEQLLVYEAEHLAEVASAEGALAEAANRFVSRFCKHTSAAECDCVEDPESGALYQDPLVPTDPDWTLG